MFITHSWILFAVLAFGSTQNELPKSCNITDDIQGECILLQLCPQAIQLLKIDRKSLINLICGYDKLDAKVCCVTNKTDGAITFTQTHVIATSKPEVKSKPTVILPPDPDRIATMRPSTTPSAVPNRVICTTPSPSTTPHNHKETKFSSEVDPVFPSSPHRDGEVIVAPTEPIPFRTNPPVSEYETGGQETEDQKEISPPLPPQSDLASGSSSSGANSAPPPSVQYPADILPSRNVCGQIATSDRIFGGEIAGLDELPWLVRIKYLLNSKESYACHGSLITDRFVLTAAHCVVSHKIIDVRLGEWDADTDVDCVQGDCSDAPVDIKVEQTFVYPSYNRRTLIGDIALLRLATPVNFTGFIQPVCLPNTEYVARQDYNLDNEYLTGGWGRTEFEPRSVVKRKVKLRPVAMETCRIAIKSINEELAASTICAGGRMGEDSCAGDSGSSLVKTARENRRANWFIYGVTSFGPKRCGTEGFPGIYTRTTYYMNWIMSVLASFPK